MNLALIGQTLGHSLSVPIHEAYFALTGRSDRYQLIELAPERVGSLREMMREREIAGLNVTIPYKIAAMGLMDLLTDDARRVGAVNTVSLREDMLIGHNTDAQGFSAMLRRENLPVAGARCAVLGASGGAARAVIEALLAGGADRIWLVSRQAEGKSVSDARCAWIDYAHLEEVACDLVINCTPVGMAPHSEAAPVAEPIAARAGALVDLIYNPPQTRFLAMGARAGHRAVNGLYMLVAQAVASEEFWRGEREDPAITEEIYRRISGKWGMRG